MIIGDTLRFAIEWSASSPLLPVQGNCRLWLGGKYIGDYQERILLKGLAHALSLTQVEAYLLDDPKCQGLSFDRIYNYLTDQKLDNGRHIFCPAESFDNFSTRIYFHEGSLWFLWKLHDNTELNFPGYPTGLHFARVPLADYQCAVKIFGDEVEKMARS